MRDKKIEISECFLTINDTESADLDSKSIYPFHAREIGILSILKRRRGGQKKGSSEPGLRIFSADLKTIKSFNVNPKSEEELSSDSNSTSPELAKLVISAKKTIPTIKIEHNTKSEFSKFFNDNENSIQINTTNACREWIRTNYFEKLLASKKAIFYLIDIDWWIFSEKFSDLQEQSGLILRDVENPNSKNELIKFFGNSVNLDVLEVDNIQSLTPLQKIVMREIYNYATLYAGEIFPLKNQHNEKEKIRINKKKKLKNEQPLRQNELEVNYILGLTQDVKMLYMQFYFQVSDFVELETI